MVTFNEIMKYCPDNIDVYEEIKSRLSRIIPFVGAGMSGFVYPCWRDFLLTSTERLFDSNDKMAVKTLMETNYEDAADRLLSLRGNANFIADIQNSFSPILLCENDGILFKQAVYLFPLLFKGPIVTTNYDKTIEYVFSKYNKHIPCGRPSDTEMLIQKMFAFDSCLYKFHGDVDRPSDIVLGASSYEKNYKNDSPLVYDLKRALTGCPVLFLGSSLEKDKTLDVLATVITKGIIHYAILDCEENKLADKSRTLGDQNIRTILYPKGSYESVRIILEHLILDIEPDVYKRLSYREDEPKQKLIGSDRFSYKSGIVGFYGRKKEIQQLEIFLNDQRRQVQWWAITGEGGTGKSRLALELRRYATQIHWDTVSITSSNNLNDIHSIGRNLLITVDYVQELASDIGKWLVRLDDSRPSTYVKVLLIERQGNNMFDASWIYQIQRGIKSIDFLSNSCFNPQNFLSLSRLDNNSSISIMTDYIISQKPDIKFDIKDFFVMLRQLYDIDNRLTRPLYALMIADVWIHEQEKAAGWSKNEILDYILYREKVRYVEIINNISNKWNLINAIFFIKAWATAHGAVRVDNIKNQKKYWNILESHSAEFPSVVDLLKHNGLVSNNEHGEIFVQSIQPDILGEYYFIMYIKELFERDETRGMVEELFDVIWSTPISAVNFFIRLLNDFSTMITEKSIQDLLFIPRNVNIGSISIFSLYFSRICSVDNLEIAEKALMMLRNFSISCNEHNRRLAASMHADGLIRYLGRLADIDGNFSQVEESALRVVTMYWNIYPHDAIIRSCMIRCGMSVLKKNRENTELILMLDDCFYNAGNDEGIRHLKMMFYSEYFSGKYMYQYLRNDIFTYPKDLIVLNMYFDALLQAVKDDSINYRQIDMVINDLDLFYTISDFKPLLQMYIHLKILTLFIDDKISLFDQLNTMLSKIVSIANVENPKSEQNIPGIETIFNEIKTVYDDYPDLFFMEYSYIIIQCIRINENAIKMLKLYMEIICNNINNFVLWKRVLSYLFDENTCKSYKEIFNTEIHKKIQELPFQVIEMIRAEYINEAFQQYSMKNYEDSFFMMYIAASLGETLAEVNLAYMLRRGDVNYQNYFSIPLLLQSRVDEKDPTALINMSLYVISKNADECWIEADEYIAKIPTDVDEKHFSWWIELLKSDDAEGWLVATWLYRHNYLQSLPAQPDTVLKIISEHYVTCPDWIMSKKI